MINDTWGNCYVDHSLQKKRLGIKTCKGCENTNMTTHRSSILLHKGSWFDLVRESISLLYSPTVSFLVSMNLRSSENPLRPRLNSSLFTCQNHNKVLYSWRIFGINKHATASTAHLFCATLTVCSPPWAPMSSLFPELVPCTSYQHRLFSLHFKSLITQQSFFFLPNTGVIMKGGGPDIQKYCGRGGGKTGCLAGTHGNQRGDEGGGGGGGAPCHLEAHFCRKISAGHPLWSLSFPPACAMWACTCATLAAGAQPICVLVQMYFLSSES